MGKMKFRLIVFLLIVFVCAGCGTTARHPLCFLNETKGTEVQKDPALIHGTLDNGFQYVLLKNQTPPNRVSMHLNVFAGSIHETEEEQGLAHYLEHMLFNGSEHFKPGELITYFQSIGMAFGRDANAHTSYFNTIYDLNLPQAGKAHLSDGLLVMGDYARGALLLPDEIDRERGVILAEKRERDSVAYQRFKKELAFELPGSLITRRHPIGVTPVIEKADQDLLKGFYDKWYRPDNMVLVAVGDFDSQELTALIRDRFSSLSPGPGKAGTRQPPDLSWTPHKGIKTFYLYDPEAAETKITIERVSYKEFNTQQISDIKEEVVNLLASQILENRFSRLIRNQEAAFTLASAHTGRFLNHVSFTSVQADCEPENWQPALSQLEKLLRQALLYGFEDSEFSQVKANAISSLDSAVRQADTRQTKDLSQEILNSVNQKRLFLSPLQEQAILKPFLENLTLDQINRSFKTLWADDHRLILVSGNAAIAGEDGRLPEEEIQAIYLKGTLEPVTAYQSFQAKVFPYLSAPVAKDETERAARISKVKNDIKGLGITTVDFHNQVRLNLKQTDFQKHKMIFKLVFGYGKSRTPLDKPGLDWISQVTVNQSGLGALDMDQLEQALAGRDVDIGFSVEDGYFSLSGAADPKEARLVFELIYAYLKDPGIREPELDLAKTLYRKMVDNLGRTPDGMMEIKGNRFLANDDPRFGLAHPDQVERITVRDIRNFLLPCFKSSPLELSIAGDIHPDDVIGYAADYLGGLDPRKEPGEIPDREVTFPKGAHLELSLDTRIEKGMVRMAFPTDDFWDIHQTRRLSLLARVVSEKLRQKVREDLGASYSPYVFNQPSTTYPGYGVMHMVAQADPGEFETVHDAMVSIVRDLKQSGVTEQALDLVKKPLMTHIKDIRKKNAYWLNTVMAGSLRHPEQMEWASHMVEDYNAVHYTDLTDLAKTYLNIPDAALILIRSGKEE